MGEVLVQALKIHLSILIISGGQLVLMETLFHRFHENAKHINNSLEYSVLKKGREKLETLVGGFAFLGTIAIGFIVGFFHYIQCDALLWLGIYNLSVLGIFFYFLRNWLRKLRPFRNSIIYPEHYLNDGMPKHG